jgi:hypothetical protein
MLIKPQFKDCKPNTKIIWKKQKNIYAKTIMNTTYGHVSLRELLIDNKYYEYDKMNFTLDTPETRTEFLLKKEYITEEKI